MLRCAVVGASGYSGAELVALLAGHPEAELVSTHASASAGARFEDLHPVAGRAWQGELRPFEPDDLEGLDVAFLALPHGESAKAAARLVGRVERVVDLSGDLRLPDAEAYRRWYGREHPAPELLGRAAYGLPELFGEALAGAELVACAGCYATVAQLAAAPALALGGAVEDDVTVAGVSGTTGAGRKADVALGFSEIFGDLRAYRVGRHQHAPEMAQGLARATGRAVRVSFVPHLAPLARGIHATVVLRRAGEPLTSAGLVSAYRDAYGDAAFVDVLDPERRLASVRAVSGTNRCEIAPVLDEEGSSVVVTATIDNLLKGAAGQAVQCMNLACGLPETAGLSGVGAAGSAGGSA